MTPACCACRDWGQVAVVCMSNVNFDGWESGGGEWTFYMLNGRDAQWKQTLRHGANTGGIGSIGSVPGQFGAVKMAEALFDGFGFTQGLAVRRLLGTSIHSNAFARGITARHHILHTLWHRTASTYC